MLSTLVIYTPNLHCLTICLQICQSNYTKDLLEWVDADNLPDWLGGRSKGTLLDDIGPWSDPEVLRQIETELPVAAKALKHLRVASISASVGDMEEAEGFQSPRCV